MDHRTKAMKPTLAKQVPVDFTERLLRDAGLSEGMRVLDIGCGLGQVSLLAASIVGETGAVVGIDRDKKSLELARERTAEAGKTDLSFTECDLSTIPRDLGLFDAVVGRRVLMYLPDPFETLCSLDKSLKAGGLFVFQELDLGMVPASIVSLPLHERCLGWLRSTLEKEGADFRFGFRLHDLLTRTGAVVEEVRAEAIVQTPTSPNRLGYIIGAVLPRLVEHEVVSATEVDIETLQARLDTERLETNATYIGDMMFGAWARKTSGHSASTL